MAYASYLVEDTYWVRWAAKSPRPMDFITNGGQSVTNKEPAMQTVKELAHQLHFSR